MREHLDVDTGLVHLLETPLAELVHAIGDRRVGLDGAEILDQLAVVIVLLDRNDLTMRLLQHGRMFPPFYAGASYQRVRFLSRRF
jgi:hypothetical protein